MRSLPTRLLPWLPLLRIAAATAFVLIGVLSLVPGRDRPHTGMPGQLEHFTAYCLTALVTGLQLPLLSSRIALAAVLCAYAGLLELLQKWIPGRTSQFIDFAASSSGAWFGILISVVLLSLMHSPSASGKADS